MAVAREVIAADKPAHHELGASARGRWGRCPGSVAACRGRPNVDSPASKEGTLAHAVAEARLLRWFGLIPDGDPRGKEPKHSPEMSAKVQDYVDYCIEQAEGADVVAVEHRVNLDPAGVPGGYGTADFVAVHLGRRRVDIIDLKFGQGVRVHAPENEQLELYGIGTYLDYDWVGEIDTVAVHIVQPRLDHIDVWEFPVSEVRERIARVKEQAAAAVQADAPRIPGEKQCRFCLAKADCKELAAFSLAEVVSHFDNLEAELAQPSDPRRPEGLTDEEVAEAYKRLPLIETWAKAISARAFDIAAKGELPGYKIVEGRSNRKWDDEDQLILDLTKAGYTPDDYAELKVLSPAALEKRLGKKHELIAAHVTRAPGKPTLAGDWDKRPAIDVNADALGMFSNEEEGDD